MTYQEEYEMETRYVLSGEWWDIAPLKQHYNYREMRKLGGMEPDPHCEALIYLHENPQLF